MQVTVTWTSGNPNTIANKLAVRIGRTPTDAELKAEVHRILTDGLIERATAGTLPHQKR